jgi:CysZ protein
MLPIVPNCSFFINLLTCIQIYALLKQIVIAIQSYFEAHRFIVTHKLWRWIVIPGIIYAILFGVSIYFFSKSATAVIEWLTNATGLGNWIKKFENSWLGFLFTFAGVLLWLIQMLFYFSLFKYVWLIVGSPIFSYLSEKTESIIEGKDFPFNLKQIIKDCWRGTKLALRNTLWQTIYLIGLVLLTFIPLFGWVTPLIALFIECYYYGFSMIDYSCERHKLPASKSIHYISRHRGLAIGNGMVFYAMHSFLFVGWVVAPAYAVVAATLSLYKVNPD